jgi:Bardet-Biedl syndrome 4 protein
MEDADIDDGPGIMASGPIRAMPMSITGMKKPSFSSSVLNQKERLNWLIHILFLRQDWDESLRVIEAMLEESKGRSEYALYSKALILRVKGNIHESLELFKKCHLLNPTNIDYLK